MKKKLTVLMSVLFGVGFISTTVVEAQQTKELEQIEKRDISTLFSGKKGLVSPASKLKFKSDESISEKVSQFFYDDSWINTHKVNYTYSNDGLTVTQQRISFDGEAWQEDGTETTSYTPDGNPSYFEGIYEGFNYKQEFFYTETGRLDSVYMEYSFDGEQSYERIALDYVTADSIRLLSRITEYGETFTNESSYFLHKNGNFIEVYIDEDYFERTTYYDITFSEFIKGISTEFFFVDMLTENWEEESGWVPVERIIHELQSGRVLEVRAEYFWDDDWHFEFKSTYEYENDKIAKVYEHYLIDDEWVGDYRTLYAYGSETVSNEQEVDQAFVVHLYPNYPNPFNPSTIISYYLPEQGVVKLEVFDLVGKSVAILENGFKFPGEYNVVFDAKALPSGIYYYRLTGQNFAKTNAMALIK